MSDRILVGYIDDGRHSGIDKYLLQVLAAAEQEQIGLDFLTNSRDAELELLLQAKGARLFEIPSLKHPIRRYRRIAELIRREQYRKVYFNISEPLNCIGCLAARVLRVPRILVHSHSAGIDRASFLARAVRNGFNLLSKPLLTACGTDFFACSEMAGRWLFPKKVLKSPRFHVIYNPVPLADFAFSQEAREAVRCEFQIPENALVLAHVGNFCYQKNNSFLIDILVSVLKRNRNAFLLSVGCGEELDAAKRKAEEYGVADRAVFPGVRRDISNCLSAADVFLLPSRFEGFGIVAVEAQANGLPCVFSTGVPEDVQITDRICFLPLGNASHWAETVLHFADSRMRNVNFYPGSEERFDPMYADEVLKTLIFSDPGTR